MIPAAATVCMILMTHEMDLLYSHHITERRQRKEFATLWLSGSTSTSELRGHSCRVALTQTVPSRMKARPPAPRRGLRRVRASPAVICIK